MLRNIIISLTVCLILSTSVIILFAETPGPGTGISTAQVIGVQEVGNEVCPVSGEEVNDESKATYEYQGKIYNLCCAACIEAFKDDPQKYVKIVEEEIKREK